MTDFRLPFDEPIFRAVNDLGYGWLDAIFVAASSRAFGIAAALALIVFVVVSLKKKALSPVLQAGAALLLTDRVGHLVLKPLIGRLRPCFALQDVRLLVDIAHSGSMPSLHAANSFAFATAVALNVRGSAKLAFPVATLVALSRVGVGVHWPSDILAGALYGTAVAVVVFLFVKQFRSPHANSVHPERSLP